MSDSPFAVRGVIEGFYGNPWTQAQRLASPGAAQQLLFERRTTQSNTNLAPTQYASWLFPGITNKALYDWDTINIVSVNVGKSKARVYNLEFEQELRPNLNFSAGWFHSWSPRRTYRIAMATSGPRAAGDLSSIR